jgi:cysteine-rich repeat protein
MRWSLVVLALGGCVTSHAVTCEDGTTCPAGATCLTITPIGTYCALPDELAACDGKQDGDECTIHGTAGTCHAGACLVDRCGNGVVDHGEVCDDGNTSAMDGCSADCRSTEVCGNGIPDPSVGEQCDLGDPIGHDGCASDCQLETAVWQVVGDISTPRQGMAYAYDPDRHRGVMFGGGNLNGTPYGDTNEWTGHRWVPIRTPVAPDPQQYAPMAYDVGHHELVLVQNATTWTRDRSGWHLRTPAHAPQQVTALVYDAARTRVMAFGGTGFLNGTPLQWSWDGTDWQELPAPPMAFRQKYQPAIAYDSQRAVVVMFGGMVGQFGGVLNDELWEFDGTTWTQRTKVATWPSPRAQSAMTFDPGSHRLLLVGGDTTSDAWEWDGTAWTPAPFPTLAGGATGVYGHAMATDTTRDVVTLVGLAGDVYELSGTTWSMVVQTMSLLPAPRTDAAAGVDPLYRELVVYGGRESGTAASDTWYWTGSWAQLATASPTPARIGAAMAYDPIRRDLVMFGGYDGASGYFADTWVWSHPGTAAVGTWSKLTTAMSPPARGFHMMAWDGVRGRILVIGGQPAHDQYSFDGTTWIHDTPATMPTPTFSSGMTWDPINRNVVLFGGTLATDGTTTLAETWIWDGTAWTQQALTVQPSPRTTTQLAWDAARRRVLLFGGAPVTNGLSLRDRWEWDGHMWTPQVPAPDTHDVQRHVLVTAPDGVGVISVGGAGTAGTEAVRRVYFDTNAARIEECTTTDYDGDGLAGCADPDCWTICTPLCPPGATQCPSGPSCGDGTCDALREACDSCPSDCGPC